MDINFYKGNIAIALYMGMHDLNNDQLLNPINGDIISCQDLDYDKNYNSILHVVRHICKNKKYTFELRNGYFSFFNPGTGKVEFETESVMEGRGKNKKLTPDIIVIWITVVDLILCERDTKLIK